ncbi:MAG: T9SS type A sorting domain-containing protein [Cyclobacteriaceae bacterium]|nr:T9SS type A sorting domain-containing protein [Cyclobacteriaceae bacterium]UYN87237.1 MAG: T9SS type A sorting domain-containing protein [Cyclobacteriaceae bacterium]
MRLIVVFVFVTRFAVAQFTYTFHQQVPVIVGQDTLKMPWAGGLNTAQFNTIDLDGDGKNDLALFDRMANRVITFLNVDNTWKYAPEYEPFFPDEVSGFMILRDYNCDGKKDLFTKDVQGVKVFRNTTQAGQPLSWEQVLFYTGYPGAKSPVLLTKGFSGKINLQLQADDLPALVDLDGDGDLDILNVKFVGSSTIEFHKNFSKERYGTCDSLDFERITQTWGDVEECDCGVFAFGEPCNTGGRTKHAGGKSLLALDLDNDGDMDILFSEAGCTRIYQLTNTGTHETPLITSASNFPSGAPISILQFPAVFYEDVDFDGRKDLMASPSIFAREFIQTDLQQSTWFYKNTGTQQLPQFTFERRNFLQHEMIDVSDNAVPAFYDADGDGDLDMFIGTFVNGTRGSIYYYENIGNRNDPVFKLVTDNLLGLSFYNFTNIKPQFADVNGDAKMDLVFTASNATGIGTNLYYVLNNNNVGLNFNEQQVQSLNFPIFSSENILVTDINNDLKPDLLVGKRDGSLQYWQNMGTTSVPVFILTNNAYLGLGASILRQNLSMAVGDLNADGLPDLILGDQNGKLSIINNFKEGTNANNAVTDIIYNPLNQNYVSHNLGGRVWPAIANLFNTTKPAIVAGNILGGLHMLQHDESVALPEDPQITIYPNPVRLDLSPTINISVDRPAMAYVLSLTGQEVGQPILLQGQQLYQFKVDSLAPGMYIMRFFINQKSYARRFIVH